MTCGPSSGPNKASSVSAGIVDDTGGNVERSGEAAARTLSGSTGVTGAGAAATRTGIAAAVAADDGGDSVVIAEEIVAVGGSAAD